MYAIKKITPHGTYVAPKLFPELEGAIKFVRSEFKNFNLIEQSKVSYTAVENAQISQIEIYNTTVNWDE